MKKILLTLAFAVALGTSGCGILGQFSSEDIADIIDIIINEDQAVLADSLASFVGGDVAVADAFDVSASVDTSSAVVIVVADSPVVSSVIDVNADPATEYSLSFVATPIREGLFKVSVVVSGVEDVGPFTSFQWDSSIPDSIRFDGVLPGTDGVTNGFAGIACQCDPENWKYGRVGGYSSSLAPGSKSGVLLDAFYSGPIELSYDIVYFNLRFSYGAAVLPLASNPQIDLDRQLVEPSG